MDVLEIASSLHKRLFEGEEEKVIECKKKGGKVKLKDCFYGVYTKNPACTSCGRFVDSSHECVVGLIGKKIQEKRKKKSLTLYYNKNPELFEKLMEIAEAEERSLYNQIIYFLKKAVREYFSRNQLKSVEINEK